MFDLQTYTLIHVLISLAALFTGIPLLFAFAAGQARPGLASLTIALLVLTSATGFGFPFTQFLPSHAVGILSTLVLALAIFARWGGKLAAGWRSRYALSLVTAVYFDAFVALVQAFLKIPALNVLAPTQQSPGFIIGHSLLLIAFIALGIASLRGFRRAVL